MRHNLHHPGLLMMLMVQRIGGKNCIRRKGVEYISQVLRLKNSNVVGKLK